MGDGRGHRQAKFSEFYLVLDLARIARFDHGCGLFGFYEAGRAHCAKVKEGFASLGVSCKFSKGFFSVQC